MTNIATVKTWPNDAVVEAIQGKVVKSYEYRTVGTPSGQKTVQNAEFQDSAGDKIRIVAWEHPDLKPLEGKEVVLHSSKAGNSKFGGVKVVHGSYVAKKDGNGVKAGDTVPTLELSISKLGQFQLVEVYNQTAEKPAQQAVKSETKAGTGPDIPKSPEPVKNDLKPIHGATVGMAINQACSSLIAKNEALDPKKVYEIASGLVRVALHMEQGHLAEVKHTS